MTPPASNDRARHVVRNAQKGVAARAGKLKRHDDVFLCVEKSRPVIRELIIRANLMRFNVAPIRARRGATYLAANDEHSRAFPS